MPPIRLFRVRWTDEKEDQEINKQILLAELLGSRKRGKPRPHLRMKWMKMLECGTDGCWHEIGLSGKSSLRRPRRGDEM